MECKKEQNKENNCTCSYPGCPRKGICCECLQHHLRQRQLPGCCFPPAAEKSWDRSFEAFAAAWQLKA